LGANELPPREKEDIGGVLWSAAIPAAFFLFFLCLTFLAWHDCPRITADFIAEEERALGRSWVAQEYECSFEAMEGLVYPDFAQCVVDMCPPMGKCVGGIDWGRPTAR
jgi:hypothetical protein